MTTSSQQQYNALIVGGGPSGAAAGTILAKGGLSVAILEKSRFPREKTCGGLLSGRCLRVLEAVFGDGVLSRFGGLASTGFRMFHRHRLVAEVLESEKTHSINRSEMDACLIQAAREAGCKVREGCQAVEIDADRSTVKTSTGDCLHGTFIIGADGVNSRVRRAIRPDRKDTQRASGFGIVADIPLENLQDSLLREACARLPHVFFGVVSWGYGWIFPKGETVCVGVGGLLNKKVNFRHALEQLVGQTCRSGTWSGLRIRGQHIPCGDFEKNPGRRNLLLVGDAAGLVEPVTGEGISFAIESAKLAAEAVLEAQASATPHDAGRIYNATIRRNILRHLRHAALARWLFFPRPCLPLALFVLRRRPKLVDAYLKILSGTLTYPAYFRQLFLGSGS